jgi:hypothetical protein
MSFFGSFFGNDQRKDIEQANAKATAALDKGKTEAIGSYGQAKGYFDPYAQQGGRANALYGDALGVNGEGARSAATANFAANNPYSQAGDDYAMKGVLRQYNARGQSYGGNAMLAAQRVGSERFDNRYNNWMGQLQGQGQQGLQATGAQAGLQQGIGDIQSGYGQQSASNAINYGNAMAGSRNIGLQNLMGVAGLGLKAFSPTPSIGQQGGYGPQQPSPWQNFKGSINQLWG